jgi:hypothetical protein
MVARLRLADEVNVARRDSMPLHRARCAMKTSFAMCWRPKGFGRRRAIGGVAATRRWKAIAFVASPTRWPRGAPNAAIATPVTGH